METKSNLKIKIKEQEEILELIKSNLRDREIAMKEKTGNTSYSEEMMNFYLDQFSETTRNLEILKNKLEILKREYWLFPVIWKIKNRYYEKRNKKRNR